MRYVALLRGINVGGKNRVPMKDLKQYVEDLGYKDVVTYINSGNVIFTSKDTEETIKETIESMITKKFNLEVPVMIVSYSDLKEASINIPNWWNIHKDYVYYAIFVLPPHKPETLIKEVGIREEYEHLEYFNQVIFWGASRSTHSKTKWSKVSGLEAGKKITVRNANTFNKLLALMEEIK